MRLLNSMSSRFSRSHEYTLPEFRRSRPKPSSRGICVVAPAVGIDRPADNRPAREEPSR